MTAGPQAMNDALAQFRKKRQLDKAYEGVATHDFNFDVTHMALISDLSAREAIRKELALLRADRDKFRDQRDRAELRLEQSSTRTEQLYEAAMRHAEAAAELRQQLAAAKEKGAKP